jgi:hypothetical protein
MRVMYALFEKAVWERMPDKETLSSVDRYEHNSSASGYSGRGIERCKINIVLEHSLRIFKNMAEHEKKKVFRSLLDLYKTLSFRNNTGLRKL